MFIFDINKSRSNQIKHGLDFKEAQLLWEDPNIIQRRTRSIDEIRYSATGLIHGIMWTAIYTHRNDCIRIISVRRARQNEKEDYYRSRI
ncbi:BrnT family toxin [bacterium]|nr:BrnT family toxin [bacterium]